MDVVFLIVLVAGVAALGVVGFLVLSFLLGRISAKGGTSDHDATAIANQVLAETDAFLGSRSASDPKWAGQVRLAEPTSDGRELWPGVVAPPRRDGRRAHPS
jgi:hypothetical protein